MIYTTLNWKRASDALFNFEWARDVLRQRGPGNSRQIRQAKAELRRLNRTEAPVLGEQVAQ